MDSIEEWACKRYDKLNMSAKNAAGRANRAWADWYNIATGKTPPASVTLRYEVWKRSQLRKQNGHTNDKP